MAASRTTVYVMPPFLHLLIVDDRLRTVRTATAVTLFALILLLGSIPGARAEIGNVASGIVLHSIAYATLTLLLFTGYAGTRTERAVKAVLSIAAMGAIDELVQSMLSYRHGTVLDWGIDCTASVLTALLLWAFLPPPGAGKA